MSGFVHVCDMDAEAAAERKALVQTVIAEIEKLYRTQEHRPSLQAVQEAVRTGFVVAWVRERARSCGVTPAEWARRMNVIVPPSGSVRGDTK